MKEVLRSMTNSRRLVMVWIQGSCFAGSIRTMLAGNGEYEFRPSKNIIDADIVVYTGGADINPALYGENKLSCTNISTQQDRSDVDTYHEAKKHDIPQVGICRGAQLLNAMNGGVLWQDVNHHAGNNHLVQDVVTKRTYEVSSLHHQQCILGPKGKLLAFCEEADRKLSSKGAWFAKSGKPSVDVEAFWYPESKSLGVQWHPELGPKDCIDLFFQYVKKYIIEGEIENEVERAVG